ncbi:hypothetical protein [Pluralibacter gergoviae]|uniref:hypothetical protein n=1 Tax=Pluralibacter gergoviae TaxID=61647 RepID=UPI003890D6CC
MESENKMVNEKGNFTAKYYNYYVDHARHSHLGHGLFINKKNRDSISVVRSDDDKELIVKSGLHFSEIDPRELGWFKLEAERSGFKDAEYSQHYFHEVARFPYTDSGLDDAGDYIRAEAKRRGMVQNNGWPFKMAF